jgi:hydantoinase/carbamoylase family amidase
VGFRLRRNRHRQHYDRPAMERLEQLARIGGSSSGGVTRVGLGRAEQHACELVATWMAEDGLEVSWDAAGNLFGRTRGLDPAAPEVWSGSHLDSVPEGGRFDGTLGVLLALEAARRLAPEPLPATLAVCVFRDEEGFRFGRGTFGSRAVCGRLCEADLDLADSDGTTVRAALSALGFMGLRAPRAALPGSFVEVHVEQGPVLERAGVPLAVVTAITGIAGYDVRFHGESGHAGTLPMAGRRDAFLAAAEFALALRDEALLLHNAVATVGDVRIIGGAANVVPSRVEATVDVRAPTLETLTAIADAATRLAQPADLEVEIERVAFDPPVPLSRRVRAVLREAADSEGAATLEFGSGAGHDAGILAAAGVEAGMLFVRSRNGGVSHRPEELTDQADICVAAGVLTRTLRALCGSVA